MRFERWALWARARVHLCDGSRGWWVWASAWPPHARLGHWMMCMRPASAMMDALLVSISCTQLCCSGSHSP